MATWQEQTNKTLKRIEAQADDSDLQTGSALNFREKVLISLARMEEKFDAFSLRVEEFMKDSRDDRRALNICVDRIPSIETGLNNHIHTHDTILKYILYPLGSAGALAFIGALLKLLITHKLF